MKPEYTDFDEDNFDIAQKAVRRMDNTTKALFHASEFGECGEAWSKVSDENVKLQAQIRDLKQHVHALIFALVFVVIIAYTIWPSKSGGFDISTSGPGVLYYDSNDNYYKLRWRKYNGWEYNYKGEWYPFDYDWPPVQHEN